MINIIQLVLEVLGQPAKRSDALAIEVEVRKLANTKGVVLTTSKGKATSKAKAKAKPKVEYTITNKKSNQVRTVSEKSLEKSIEHINKNDVLGATTKQIIHRINQGVKLTVGNRVWAKKVEETK